MEVVPKDPSTHPLHRLVVEPRAKLNRVHALVYTCAIMALFYHRFLHLIRSNDLLSFYLLLSMLVSEMILAFMWATALGFRWRPAHRREFPEKLSEVIDDADLPALDVFICTADPYKEPPMNVVNTALSMMAFDYPTDKISVYISDDGGSDLTLFAFMEAAKFAGHWLPYCRENGIEPRCPEAYLGTTYCKSSEKIKMLYESMKEKVERVVERGRVIDGDITSDDDREAFNKWTDGFSRHDHPAVIQVLLESSKDMDVMGHHLPNLVYVSRQKSRSSPHHYKAGALNVLLRVSAAMSNAPVVLTLDCDMYSNDPQTPRRALCYLLDPTKLPKLAFVQFPQRFRGVNKNDTYSCEWRRLFVINPVGMDGLSGTSYVGTGCFFNRQALYDEPLPTLAEERQSCCDHTTDSSIRSEPVLRMAHLVASCTYEHGTEWGSKMGVRYGSLVEDFYTGYRLHCEGWESVFCNPEKAAFVGDVPISLSDVLSQTKRWCVGLLEVSFSKFNPLITIWTTRISLEMGMCYTHYAFWSAWSIPITTYAFLPQLALLYQIPLFPKVSDLWLYLYVYLFIGAYAQDLIEFLIMGGTIQRWWNDQRMWMTRGLTSYLFSLIEFSLKQIGFSGAGFSVTNKVMDDDQNKRYKQGIFEFGVSSPMFMALSMAAAINLIAFTVGFARVLMVGILEQMLVQLLISGFVMVNSWPIYEGMILRRDKGRIPTQTTTISIVLALVLCIVAFFAIRI
ncbi:cellulose synthase-like protein G3 [Magnolia sinica]|uniref:cellulose synthase-like protein G3 n=1 Tax=Magnolia sinica TaxID=86752 RepID=UPI0026582E47|nr:cellulose synthase-like protein G3 [Magnolia sinica]